MLTRRTLLRNGTLASMGAVLTPPSPAQAASSWQQLPAALAHIEQVHGGRLGVAVLDTATHAQTGHRSAERFAMCSTCKVLLSAAVLQRVDAGQEQLTRTLAVPPKPLIGNSPITEQHASATLPIAELCRASLTRSDNTATNLLLETIGGPAAWTQFARSLGDPVSRLDRTETALNEAKPGDPRDTTTPTAMAANLQTLLLGSVLSAASRQQLKQWMMDNVTGLGRLRVAVPQGWQAGDKTGSDGVMTSNDIAVFWPPNRAPVIVTAFLTECPGPEDNRAAALADIGRLVVTYIQSI